MRNVAIDYQYRDGNNFKTSGTARLKIEDEAELEAGVDRILTRLTDDKLFIPEKVGLKPLAFSDGHTDADHPWHEWIDVYWTDQPVTEEQSFEDLLGSFLELDKWDESTPVRTWRDRLPANKAVDKFTNLHAPDEEEDTIFADIEFFGQLHHAMFVRVVEHEQEGWVAVCDPFDRLSDIYSVYEQPMIPVTIPNIDGKWMILVHPWGD